MPRPDRTSRNVHRAISVQLSLTSRLDRKRRKRKDEGGELAPVEPDRPTTLSGGAAAALEFDA